VRFNGTELIANYPPEVFNILLRTWIGPIPPSTAFKDQLLGNSIDMDADELLTDIQPQSSRVALAASWMAPPPEAAVEQTTSATDTDISETETELPAAETLASEQPDAVPEGDLKPDALAAGAEPSIADIEQVAENTGVEVDTQADNAEPQEEEIADFNVSEALAQRDYTPLVVAQIYKAIRYPNRAADKNQQGTVRIGVTIDRSGELISAVTTQESRYRLLNQAALKAVKKAAPFPQLPEEMKADSFEVNLPITFRLQ
jgi:TonB family protein